MPNLTISQLPLAPSGQSENSFQNLIKAGYRVVEHHVKKSFQMVKRWLVL